LQYLVGIQKEVETPRSSKEQELKELESIKKKKEKEENEKAR